MTRVEVRAGYGAGKRTYKERTVAEEPPEAALGNLVWRIVMHGHLISLV
jgi:hypothetical protein